MPPPSSTCQVCGLRAGVSPDSLFKCSRCQAVLYCGRDHQREHFATHKSMCKRIKRTRELMEKEAHKIRNAEEDDWTPANAFEAEAGHFWGIHSTRPYMRAKMDLIATLSTLDSRPAIETALAEALDCLRLCRGDNVGVREVVPTLMLLLGQVQEAYDFIKWYATSGNDMHYDWGDMDLPYLDVHGADTTEEPEGSLHDVFMASSLVYIKMVLAKAAKDAITAHELADRASLPSVVTDSLGSYLAPNGQTRSLAELKMLHTKLTRQVREAFSMAHSRNEHFWGAMLDPFPLLETPSPGYYAHGDENQVKLWILQNAMLWMDHLEFIREHLG